MIPRSKRQIQEAMLAKFAGTLAILLAVLGLSFFVFLWDSGGAEVKPFASDVIESVNASRRQQQLLISRLALRSQQSQSNPVQLDDLNLPPRPQNPKAAKPEQPDAPPMLAQSRDAQAELTKAIKLIDQNDINAAKAILEGMLQADPRDEQALVELAMIHLIDLRQPDQALGYLQRALEVNPANQIVTSELVSLYEETGRTDEGLSFLMDIESKQPGDGAVASAIGQMLSRQGREQEAISYFEKATKQDMIDGNAQNYQELADAYAKNGQIDKALDVTGKAVAAAEQEVQQLVSDGQPTRFAEDKVAYMKMDEVNLLIQSGAYDEANRILNEVEQKLPGHERIAVLRAKIKQASAG